MWTRAELKMRAKQNLSRYYGPALFVSFIANMFTSSGGGGSSSGGAAAGVNSGAGMGGDLNYQAPLEGVEGIEDIIAGVPGAVDSFVEALDPVAMSVIASIAVVAIVIGFVLITFVSPLFEVGKNRFYMESRATGYSVGIQELLWGFTHNYLNIVWTMFLKNMIVFLGTLCCVIPGVYLGYCYYMVPYILAENPDMRAGDVLRMSKEMMTGNKMNTLVLEVSFWGWWILGTLLCGVGGVLIQPYYDATFAELYAVLRQKFQYNLNGFGHSDIGYDGGQGGAYQEYRDYGRDDYYSNNRSYEYNDDYYRNGGGTDVTQQQYVPSSERNESPGAGQESSGQRNAEGGGNTDYGYYQGTDAEHRSAEQNSPVVQEERGREVKRSEGGPGRGYYLNGVFYPYTDDELRQLEENKHKN